MAAERKPAVPKTSSQKSLKTMHRKYLKGNPKVSLKEFVKGLTTDEDRQKASDWVFNKRANFSKPSLGLGSTRKKKSSPNQKKA